jgi:uncharacterized membrane protein YtjA (UPF0391 family)
LVLAGIAALFGFSWIAEGSANIAKVLFVVFLVVSAIIGVLATKMFWTVTWPGLGRTSHFAATFAEFLAWCAIAPRVLAEPIHVLTTRSEGEKSNAEGTVVRRISSPRRRFPHDHAVGCSWTFS